MNFLTKLDTNQDYSKTLLSAKEKLKIGLENRDETFFCMSRALNKI